MLLEAALIDHDDCLVPTKPGEMSNGFYAGARGVWDRLGKLQEKGVLTGICTGRDRNYVEACALWLGLRLDWCIIESGIALFRPVTKELLLNPALTPDVRETFVMLRSRWVPEILKRFPELFEYPGNQVQLTLELKHGTKTPINEFYQAIKEMLGHLEKQGLIVIHASQIAVDISPVGRDGNPIDKSSGVDLYSEVTGVPPSHILGIGDSGGDLPFLRKVGWIGCPSNATPECKKLVMSKNGYVSPFPHSEGVDDVLSHFPEE